MGLCQRGFLVIGTQTRSKACEKGGGRWGKTGSRGYHRIYPPAIEKNTNKKTRKPGNLHETEASRH